MRLILFECLIFAVSIGAGQCWFERCDHSYPLTGTIQLQSPYYPGTYKPLSSCRYEFIAPVDYQISIACTIDIPKSASVCSTDMLMISGEGLSPLRNSDYKCGTGSFQITTVFNKLVVAYTSSDTAKSGKFACNISLIAPKPNTCDCGWSVNKKIVGGVEAGINEFPFIAGVLFKPSNQPFCSATIISTRFLVSAAHCYGSSIDANRLEVLVGEHDLRTAAETPYTSKYAVQSVLPHPDFNPNTDNNDIALLITVNNIQWYRGVGPACLPLLYSFSSFENYPTTIAGWGTTLFAGPTSQVLLKATVRTVSNDVCRPYFPALTASQICTMPMPNTNSESCQNDSGGPVLYQGSRTFIVGVISTGDACGTMRASVNTRITSHLDWILRYVNVNSLCKKSM